MAMGWKNRDLPCGSMGKALITFVNFFQFFVRPSSSPQMPLEGFT
jgi:hypothetical protein